MFEGSLLVIVFRFDYMDNGKLTRVVFLDIRKAFDSIDHSILEEVG